MPIFKTVYLIFLLVVFFAKTACANAGLEIKPVEIEVFKDDQIFAKDRSGKYQIGQIGGKWSKVHDMNELGLSFLVDTVATKDGMFLIGAEGRPDTDKRNYYTALIVLIDSSNKIIKEWRNEDFYYKGTQFNNNVLLTSFNGVFTLNATGEPKRIKNNEARVNLLPLYDNEGSLILCRPGILAKIVMLDGGVSTCKKAGAWTFSGAWYASSEGYTTVPVICGSWIVEPVQLKYQNPITEIFVRDLKTGEIVTRRKMKDTHHMLCLNNSTILTDSNMYSFTLPEMKRGKKYKCNKGGKIISVKAYKNESVCLTSTGFLGVLKK